jgi:UDP-N-acetylmuramate--alanine ligase
MVRARELGNRRLSRAELNAALFNAAPTSIGIAGTSGKSTVTGMLGWIMHETGRYPTVMNGAVMKNFVSPDVPFASAVVGKGEVYVSEVDESDGSIALYLPTVAVLLNVSLDHKSMDELRVLFGDFLRVSKHVAVNADDPEALALVPESALTFGIDNPSATISASGFSDTTTSLSATISAGGASHELQLAMPGRHNLANALAAIAGAHAAPRACRSPTPSPRSPASRASPAGSTSSAARPPASP